MEIIKSLNVGLRFILELILLFVFAYSSYQIIDNTVLRWGLAVALPIAVASLWGYYIAPKSQHVLSMPWRSIVVIILFSFGAALLTVAGQGRAALYLITVFAINEALLIMWKQ